MFVGTLFIRQRALYPHSPLSLVARLGQHRGNRRPIRSGLDRESARTRESFPHSPHTLFFRPLTHHVYTTSPSVAAAIVVPIFCCILIGNRRVNGGIR